MKILKISYLLFVSLVVAENEFVVPKKKENLSSSKLKESIIKEFGEILDVDTDLSEVLLDMRKVTLEEIKSGINGDNKYLSKATKNELKELNDELVSLKNELNLQKDLLKNKLSKLKKKFNIK